MEIVRLIKTNLAINYQTNTTVPHYMTKHISTAFEKSNHPTNDKSIMQITAHHRDITHNSYLNSQP